MKLSRRRLIALIIFVAPWIFWVTAIASASNSGFVEDQYAVQIMVLGGAISMVAGAVASLAE